MQFRLLLLLEVLTFLESLDFLDFKNLTFNSKGIFMHLCVFTLPELSVSSESLKTSDIFFLISVGRDVQWLPFPSSVERMETQYAASGAPYGLTFLASAFEVKMVTREKNIFGSKPKKRTFLLILALLSSWF